MWAFLQVAKVGHLEREDFAGDAYWRFIKKSSREAECPSTVNLWDKTLPPKIQHPPHALHHQYAHSLKRRYKKGQRPASVGKRVLKEANGRCIITKLSYTRNTGMY
jgi:hypothetical protein